MTNTEINLANHTKVKDVNSAGTRTATIILSTSNIVTTHTVTFPTNFFADYPSSYTFCGTLPTAISGVSTCIKHPCAPFKTDNPTAYITYSPFDSNAAVFAYPSHPSVLQTSTVRTSIAPDFKGLTYEAVWGAVDDYQRVYDLFPGLGVLQCLRGSEQAPATTKNVALYLTATSTSTESHAAPTSNEPQATSLSTSLGSISAAATEVILTSNHGYGSIVPSTARASGPLPASSGTQKSPAALPSDIPHTTMPPSVPFAIGGQTISVNAESQIVLSGQTLTLGSPIILGSGHTTTLVQLHTSRGQTLLEAGSSIFPLPAIPTKTPGLPALNRGSQVVTPNTDNHYVIGSHTVAPGSPVTLGFSSAATPVMLQTVNGHTVLIVGSSISTLVAAATATGASTPAQKPAFIIGSQVITANSENQYIVGSQTLAPGSQITVGSGSAFTPVMLQTTNNHKVLVLGSSTSTLAVAAMTAVAASGHPQPFTIGSQVITANSKNQYVVGSQTLAPGSQITIGSGGVATPILLQTTNGDTLLIVGSSTSTLAPGAAAAATDERQPLTIGSQVVTANSNSQYIIGSQTLTTGGLLSVSGTPVSLAPGATEVIIGSSTEGLGGYIISGLGAGPSASSTIGHIQNNTASASPTALKSAASSQWQSHSGWRKAVWTIAIMTFVGAVIDL